MQTPPPKPARDPVAQDQAGTDQAGKDQAAGKGSPLHTASGEPAETYTPRSPETSLPPYPVNARGLTLSVLSALAVVFCLQWAVKFLVPMTLGILLSFTLNPVVKALERIRIPRTVATLLVMAAVLAGLGFGMDRLRGEFQSIVVQLPEAARRLAVEVAGPGGGGMSTLEQVQKAASELEKATTPRADRKPAQPNPPPQQAHFRVSELLWAGSVNAMEFVAQATMVVFLVFFLLTSGVAQP